MLRKQIAEVGDFSMYSADSSSKSEYGRTKATQSLNKCAYILNEVLDNGPAILGFLQQLLSKLETSTSGKALPIQVLGKKLDKAVKKRKCILSPRTEQRKVPPSIKRVKQTNRYLDTENASYPRSKPVITASTPSSTIINGTQRKRSCSANSVALNGSISNRYNRSRYVRQHSRARSLSATRTCRGERSANRLPLYLSDAESEASKLVNASAVSSEADTLTGVHMDNSSLFGVPPVFSKRQSRRVKPRESRAATRKSASKTAGWLKPQASITTQTVTHVEALPKNLGKEAMTACNKKVQSNLNDDVIITSAKDDSGKVTAILERKESQNSPQKQFKTEELQPSSQSAQEDLPQRKESASILQSLNSLREMLSTSGNGVAQQLVETLTTDVTDMVREKRFQKLTVSQLLLPFQKESRLLKAEVQTLKSKLNELNKPDSIHKQSKLIGEHEKLVSRLSEELEAERLRCRHLEEDVLHYKQLSESITQTSVNNNLSSSQTIPTVETKSKDLQPQNPYSDPATSSELKSLKLTLRLIRNRLSALIDTDIHGADTSKEFHSLLELCSQQFSDCGINSNMATVSNPQQIGKNSEDYFVTRCSQSRLESDKYADAIPSHLVHTVSRNITKARETEAEKVRIYKHPDQQLEPCRDLPLTSGLTRLQSDTTPLWPDHTSPSRRTSSPVNTYPIHILHPSSTADRLPTKYSSLSSSPPERDSAFLDTVGSGKIYSSVTSDKTSANTLSLDYQQHSNHHNDDNDTLTTNSNTLLDVCDYSDTSLATTTTADSMFQQGLAQLDANIARLEQSLRGATVKRIVTEAGNHA